MITYTLEFPVFSVQVETFIGDKFNTADTEAGRIGIYQLIICIDFRNRFVERRVFRRPEFRCIYDEVLFKRLSVIDTAGIFRLGKEFPSPCGFVFFHRHCLSSFAGVRLQILY